MLGGYFYAVVVAMACAVLFAEDALWWIGLCCYLMVPWVVWSGILAWQRCCKEDCDDEYEDDYDT